MTTSTTTPRIAYTADGSTVSFTFNFEIADSSSIAVYEGSTKKTLTTHYTITFDSGTSGTGSVVFGSAPSDSTVITLVRDTNLARTTDFTQSGAFLADTVNAELDRLSQAVIDATDKIENRAISTAEPNTDTATMTIPAAADRANKVLGFDSSGNAEATTAATGDVTLTGSQTLTNKVINADNNTISNLEVDNIKAATLVTESEGIGSNDNDTTLPTSAAVKDYVDTQITAEDLDITTDSGTIAIDLDSETLTVAGGTGIGSTATGNTVTLAIDSTVTTLTGSQTLSNKALTSPVLNTGVSGTAIKDEDDMSSNSATHLATQQSIKAYVDAQDAATGIGDLTATGSTLISPSNADLTLDPSGSGSIVLNANTSVTGSVTATTSIENDAIRITDNTIIGLRSNEDLIIDPAGTGEVRPGSDVKLLSNSNHFVGNVKNEDGNALQLSSSAGITLSNNVTGYGYIQTTGDDSYIQTESIKIDAGSGVISGRRSNEDLSLQPAGTGNVILGAVKINGTTISSDDSTKITLAENVDITGAVGITSGTITGITDLAVADGGTGVSSLTANQLLLGNGTSAIAVSGALEWQAGSSTLAVTGNQTISGNLTVSGSTTTINTTNTTIEDNIIELNSGISQSLNDAGIIIERGSTGDNAAIIWDESEDEFTLGTTTATAGDKSGGISVTAGNLKVATIEATNAAITGGTISGLTSFANTGSSTLDGVTINDNTISSNASNADLEISANGTGSVAITKAAITSGTITGITDLAVADGGTGASSLTDNAVLTGTGTSPITAESNLTFNGSTLAVTGNITATTSIANDAVSIDDNVIKTTRSNDSLFFQANGTGSIEFSPNGATVDGVFDTNTRYDFGANRIYSEQDANASAIFSDSGDRRYANGDFLSVSLASSSSNSHARWRSGTFSLMDMKGFSITSSANYFKGIVTRYAETMIKNTSTSAASTLNNITGVYSSLNTTGTDNGGGLTITSGYGFVTDIALGEGTSETVAMTNAYHYAVKGSSGGGAITNEYGVFVDGLAGTNKYGFYTNDDSYINSIGGVTLQNGDITASGVTISDNHISTAASNADLHLDTSGTGKIKSNAPIIGIGDGATTATGGGNIILTDQADGDFQTTADGKVGMLDPSGLQVDSAGSYHYSQLILNTFSTTGYNALWTTRSNSNTHGTNAYLDSGDVIFQFFGAGWNGDTDGTGYYSANASMDLYASEAHSASNRGGGMNFKTINKGASSGASIKLQIEDHIEAVEQLEFKKNYKENIDALTSSSTITVDCSAASVFTVTLATNTGFVISNLETGSSVTLIITQDGTGSRTATFGTDGSTAVKFAGSSKTLSTAASAIDVVTIFNDGTNYIGNLSKAYAA